MAPLSHRNFYVLASLSEKLRLDEELADAGITHGSDIHGSGRYCRWAETILDQEHHKQPCLIQLTMLPRSEEARSISDILEKGDYTFRDF